MKKKKILKTILGLFFVLLISVLLISLTACGGMTQSAPEETEVSPHEEYGEEAKEERVFEEEGQVEETTQPISLPTGLGQAQGAQTAELPARVEGPTALPTTLEAYKVEIAADSQIFMPGSPGKLHVWIGPPYLVPSFGESKQQAGASIPAIGQSARIRPVAPDFEVHPPTACIQLHPSGVEECFTLTPKTKGVFPVSVIIELFYENDCLGTPVPKAVRELKIHVSVDRKKDRENRISTLMEVLWDHFTKFWGAIVALFFGLLLFLIRKKLKRWFGFGTD